MTRSIRHSHIIGNNSRAESDKPDKIIANRVLRAAQRQALSCCRDWDGLVMPVLREVSNVGYFSKDGKRHFDIHDQRSWHNPLVYLWK